MNRFLKLGYILVGAGFGMFVATLMYEKEMRKPVGDIEEYIPTEDRTDEENSQNDISSDRQQTRVVSDEFSETDAHIMDYYKSDSDDSMGIKNLENRARKRREEFEKSRAQGRNQSTRYSRMYEDDANTEREKQVAERLQAQRDAEYMAYITQNSNALNDISSDDGNYEDSLGVINNDLVRERVENNFEIYLGENPQDFVSLIFYEQDNTLADDRDNVIPAADEVVGLAALSRLIEGGPGAENGVIFVRNLKTMIDYEVVLQYGSYAETVLGIFDSRRNKGAGGDVNRR